MSRFLHQLQFSMSFPWAGTAPQKASVSEKAASRENKRETLRMFGFLLVIALFVRAVFANARPIYLLAVLSTAPVFAQNAEDLPLDDPIPVQTGSVPKVEELPLEDPLPPISNAEPKTDAEHGHRHDEGEPFAEGETRDPNSFIYQALYAGLLVAALCSYLGLYVVTRRMVFVGVALAEISSTGIALGLLLGVSPLWGALGFMLLGVLILSQRYAPRRLPPDVPIGVFYTLATAASILMIAKSAQGETHMLTLLRGDILAVYPHETLQMAFVFAVIAALHLLFGKEFLLVSLDRDMASTLGYNAGRWNFLLFLTIGLAVALAIRGVGVLLTTALLILPAATALLLLPRWNRAAILAPILGMSAVAIGLALSLYGDFPTSAVIVAVLFAFFAPVLVWNTFK